jgi:transposase-like protein
MSIDYNHLALKRILAGERIHDVASDLSVSAYWLEVWITMLSERYEEGLRTPAKYEAEVRQFAYRLRRREAMLVAFHGIGVLRMERRFYLPPGLE